MQMPLATAQSLLRSHQVLDTAMSNLDEAMRLGVATEHGSARFSSLLTSLRDVARTFDDGAAAIPSPGEWPGSVLRTDLLSDADQLRGYAHLLEQHATPFGLAGGIANAQRDAIRAAQHFVGAAADFAS